MTLAAIALAFLVGFAAANPERVAVRFDSLAKLLSRTPRPAFADVALGAMPGPPPDAVPPALFRRLPQDWRALPIAPGEDLGTERFVERVVLSEEELEGRPFDGSLLVEYTPDVELSARVRKVLSRARVRRGHVIVLDPESGRVLVYVSTDPEAFPPDRAYPAASLVKIVTAAAALHHDPSAAREPCRYRGNPYRLRPWQIHRPKSGHSVSLERALATSNNHCFAQLAVHSLGEQALIDAIARFGWLEEPAPGHDPGVADAGKGDYGLGKLGCGLSGCRITPLHAAQLAASLAKGERVEPWWVHRVFDEEGRELARPAERRRRRIMAPELAKELRTMLVRTTRNGTARSAFRNRRGRALLDDVSVAGKTGNLNGKDPEGRYEWFAGVAPADDPQVAVAVVQLHDDLWWQNSASVAASVLQEVFCERSRCSAERAARYTGRLGTEVVPMMLNESAE